MTVPTWRARDVMREIDLVEEIARPVLDRIPHTMPLRRHVRGRLSKEQRLRRVVEDALVGAGLSEAYTWSLVGSDPRSDAHPAPEPDDLRPGAPANDDRAGAPRRRANRRGRRRRATSGSSRSRVSTCRPASSFPTSTGGSPASSRAATRSSRAWSRRCYDALGLELRVERSPHDLLHPGKSAETGAGWLGELHPTLLEGTWGAFELDLDALFAAVPDRTVYEDVLTYPATLQDIAVAVDEDVEVGALVDAAHEAAGDLLREARVFDVYRGEQVGEGRSPSRIHLVFQSPERTLTEEDASARARRDRRCARRSGFDAELARLGNSDPPRAT